MLSLPSLLVRFLQHSSLYLNRTNRSGIIKAGVIGGKKQDGNYKMDCRFNRKRLAEQIIHISKSSDKISFHNMDAVDFINYIEGLNLSKPILMVDRAHPEFCVTAL